MKRYEIPDLGENNTTDLAAVFHVYDENTLGEKVKTYSVNRTLNLLGLTTISHTFFTYYTVKQEDTWPLISYKNYKTIRLWWLLAKLNGVTNPFANLEGGSIIKILNTEVVEEILKLIKAE